MGKQSQNLVGKLLCVENCDELLHMHRPYFCLLGRPSDLFTKATKDDMKLVDETCTHMRRPAWTRSLPSELTLCPSVLALGRVACSSFLSRL